MMNEMPAMILNLWGNTLCWPPIVNSPNGNPQATSSVIIAMPPNNTAANIANIVIPSVNLNTSRPACKLRG